MQEKESVLHKLEEAEMRYINSFRLVNTVSDGNRLESVWDDVSARLVFDKILTRRILVDLPVRTLTGHQKTS